ncbi:hypothetical protein SEA_CIRCINUS_193 [Streptomyces phage Circinus]|uniref:Uncharacterized protein n=1 Tax=Streptomyces phage Circinus TaxID=2562189 RepID=A0A4D6E1H3_9CAUD|nr:hypothetical protein SEA_CIRCINUS_193 [Streptomyces phage Circinus]
MKDYSHLTDAEWEKVYANMSTWEKTKVNLAVVFFFICLTSFFWVPVGLMTYVALNH